MRNKRIFIYIMIPICLLTGGWVIFNRYIRSNHYQLLFPYSIFLFRDNGLTSTRIGPDHKAEINIPGGYAWVGKDEYKENLLIDEFWIDQIPVTAAEYKKFLEKTNMLPPRYHDEYQKYWSERKYDLLPVVFISWGQAEDYCEFTGDISRRRLSGKKQPEVRMGQFCIGMTRQKHIIKQIMITFTAEKLFPAGFPEEKRHMVCWICQEMFGNGSLIGYMNPDNL